MSVAWDQQRIEPINVYGPHFQFHETGPASANEKSYSYRFETPDRVIVFTGDTGPSDAVTALARGADLLVSEVNSFDARMKEMIQDGRWQAMTDRERTGITTQATRGHLSPEDVGKMAARAGVKTVVLTHLTFTPDEADYAVWADEVRKHFSGRVVVAGDLMEF